MKRAGVDAGAGAGRLGHHLRLRAAAAPGATEVGPFVCAFDPASDHPYRNYAVARSGAEPGPADVDALVRAFASRRRLPRLEGATADAPAAVAALVGRGFTVERRVRALVCAPVDLRSAPVPSDLRLDPVAPDRPEDVAGAVLAAHVGFGEPGQPERTDLDRLAAMLAGGGSAVVARRRDDEEPVGSAQATPALAGLSEVVGVAVVPGQRRRGLGAALSAAVTARAQRVGAELAWLVPEAEAAGRVYVAVGYRPAAEVVHLRLGALA